MAWGKKGLKELTCTTHGHELSGLGGVLKGWRVQGRGRKRGKIGKTVIV